MTTSDNEPLVIADRRGNVGILTINRPAARNAISKAVTIAMAAEIDRFESDDDIRVLIVTGAGDTAFCAGADLKSMKDGRPVVHELGGLAGITSRAFVKPLIAAVNGFALGGGMEICLASDLVVAEEHATFGLPEVRRGIVAAAGGLERLPHRLPPAIAMELILTGEPISAQRAADLGMVNRVVARGEGMNAALAIAEVICRGAPLAIQYSKAVAQSSIATGEHAAVEAHTDLHRAVFRSADASEGRQAFAEKRAPVWSGR
ncbi:crotonase/enoyl-CoA hydratase family protein [Nocardia salmonicida]|uniref:crotonase/enoyl-CoA hydratase family protein n=1 Tax=Nocardia salmonicida TaxID=53431 RepID=UPI0033DC5740